MGVTFLIGKIPFIGLIHSHIHLIDVHGKSSFLLVLQASCTAEIPHFINGRVGCRARIT